MFWVSWRLTSGFSAAYGQGLPTARCRICSIHSARSASLCAARVKEERFGVASCRTKGKRSCRTSLSDTCAPASEWATRNSLVSADHLGSELVPTFVELNPI